MCIRDRFYALLWDKFVVPISKTYRRILGNSSDKNSDALSRYMGCNSSIYALARVLYCRTLYNTIVVYQCYNLIVYLIGRYQCYQPSCLASVSYTHLDVYKRQFVIFTTNFRNFLESRSVLAILLFHSHLIKQH